jgi:DNA polymerase delta subunit 1
MNWVELPATKYLLKESGRRISTCQIECEIPYTEIISHAPEGQWAKIAPLRVLSFDIECAGRPGIFPEASVDPVIQIANVVTTYGTPPPPQRIGNTGVSKPFIRNVFTVDTCAQIVGAQVLEHRTQEQLLLAWKDFLQQVDPDVMIGYNISNFDLPYLIDRARHSKLDDSFPFLGRIRQSKTLVKSTTFASKAFGQRDSKETTIEGRLQLDMLQVMQRDYKLRSYSLNAVSAQFLGEQKEDVHHSIITELHNGTAESRRRLAVYCLKVPPHSLFPDSRTRTYRNA